MHVVLPEVHGMQAKGMLARIAHAPTLAAAMCTRQVLQRLLQVVGGACMLTAACFPAPAPARQPPLL